MSQYKSTKIIELGSCAFRQWRANPDLATSGLTRSGNRCFHVHGYQLKARFVFGCSSLDERNWVTDFGSLKPLKEILNNQFDHTLCIAADDPNLDLFKQLHEVNACNLKIMDGVGIEKTAEWCFEAASSFIKKHYGERCWVESVEVFEHEANSAIFTKNDTCCKGRLAKKDENNVTAQQAPVVTTPVHDNEPIPAPIGNRVTSGWSNPFGGTSWGV